jgi:hypothetical protein
MAPLAKSSLDVSWRNIAFSQAIPQKRRTWGECLSYRLIWTLEDLDLEEPDVPNAFSGRRGRAEDVHFQPGA